MSDLSRALTRAADELRYSLIDDKDTSLAGCEEIAMREIIVLESLARDIQASEDHLRP
jgi:hypothetical protein